MTTTKEPTRDRARTTGLKPTEGNRFALSEGEIKYVEVLRPLAHHFVDLALDRGCHGSVRDCIEKMAEDVAVFAMTIEVMAGFPKVDDDEGDEREATINAILPAIEGYLDSLDKRGYDGSIILPRILERLAADEKLEQPLFVAPELDAEPAAAEEARKGVRDEL